MSESKPTSTRDPPQRVIVFASQLLPWSQTFIREQVLAMRRWHPILVGERLEPDGLSLDGIDFKLLCPREAGRLRRWIYTLFRLLRLPHPPSVRRLRALNASLIHAHFGTVAVDIWPLARALGLPMVVTLHGFDINIYREWWEAGNGGWWRRRYPKQLLHLAREPTVRFIAVSEAIRRRAIAYGIPEKKITVQYIGVDTKYFRPRRTPISQRPKRVLFVGRLVEKKGTAFLIRAFSDVLYSGVDAELIIVGEGPLGASLRELAKTLRVPARFLGVMSRSEVRREMEQARVLCLPSITAANGDAEGFGMVLLEAAAVGTPAITSARGGATEGVLNGVSGLRFRECDTQELSNHLKLLLRDTQRLKSMSISSQQFVRDAFDLHKCTKGLEDYYSKQNV